MITHAPCRRCNTYYAVDKGLCPRCLSALRHPSRLAAARLLLNTLEEPEEAPNE